MTVVRYQIEMCAKKMIMGKTPVKKTKIANALGWKFVILTRHALNQVKSLVMVLRVLNPSIFSFVLY